MYERGQVQIGDGKYWIAEGVAYLPHSCDEWEIGGRQECLDLIHDLEALVDSGELQD